MEVDCCSVCLESIDNNLEENVFIIPCFHKFHKDCIIKTVKCLGNKCPMCRATCYEYMDNNRVFNFMEERNDTVTNTAPTNTVSATENNNIGRQYYNRRESFTSYISNRVRKSSRNLRRSVRRNIRRGVINLLY